MTRDQIINTPLCELIADYPFMVTFLENNTIQRFKDSKDSLITCVASITEDESEEWAIDKKNIMSTVFDFYTQMRALLGIKDEETVKSLTLVAGHNKSKELETFGEFTIHASEIIAIVGPTGSGKSRLLADIEWTADRDTPTNRQIKINGVVPDKKWRFASGNKLVAQLSQNMNFVMDLTVGEFIELHASSRMIEGIDEMSIKILDKANHLAGEPFTMDTPITSLSGGQSRALMIADTAILSHSPIVLIDEIENAGIDRKKALELLVSEEKVVLMATHDPILALMADKRIIIKNGGITDIIVTTDEEKAMLVELEKVDNYIQAKRTELRTGARLHMGKSLLEVING
ncbi:MAG: ATP-binding cassette domain-containing protein [Vallitaleaceae bacterium]|nr:ATP-binding cassette domain-containing protein [Vallitaleaceae bacterium]